MPRFLVMLFLCSLLATVPTAAQVPLPVPQTADTSDTPDVMPKTYQVSPGDILDVSVQGFDQFHSTVTVPPDGFITVTGVPQHLMAAGHTVAQLQTALTADFKRQVKRPLVTVSLRETHPRRVSVLGAVRTPGVYDWRPGLSLLEALALANGLAQVPELSQATLVSKRGTQQTPLDLVKLVTDGDPAQNVALMPGDIVLVSLRDPAAAYVQVTGQVTKPGPVAVPPGGAPLLSVLNLAGSYTPNAALTSVQVVHSGTTRTLNLHPLLYHIDDPVGQTRVFAGDVVSVPLSNSKVAVLGEVRNPHRIDLQDGEPLTVTDAIAQANGLTPQAQSEKIGIVRNVRGKTTLYEVNANAILKGEAGAQDIALLPGDTLVVPKRRSGVNGFQALGTAVGAIFGVYNVGRIGR